MQGSQLIFQHKLCRLESKSIVYILLYIYVYMYIYTYIYGIYKSERNKTFTQGHSTWKVLPFRTEEAIKNLSAKQKLKYLITTKSALREMSEFLTQYF